jgi:hypothetical protein
MNVHCVPTHGFFFFFLKRKREQTKSHKKAEIKESQNSTIFLLKENL